VSVGSAVWLVTAGTVAGVIGTAGGITSLVSYPALLAAGVAPVPASVANLVAAAACWPTSALASRRELAGRTSVLVSALPTAAAAGAVGSVLLLVTPPGIFARIVPWLVLAGSAALLAQPAITAGRDPGRRADGRSAGWALLAWVAALSIYGGYFGAGSGIMLLAALLVLHDERLPRSNAVKNMLVGAGAVASAVVFVVAGPVVWSAAAPLAAGMLIGGLLGPPAARHLPERAVRWAASGLGVALAVELWLHPR
jgi:uncharacterized membrane protein YfcA